MARPPDAAASCIFCEIAAGRTPAHIFYEDASAVAFLDLFPYTRGHSLVVPKRHFDRLTGFAPDDRAPFVEALQHVCRRIERLSTHYNVSLNQGAFAGQVVFHVHFHIIPRYGEEDPFRAGPRERLKDAEARELLRRLTQEDT